MGNQAGVWQQWQRALLTSLQSFEVRTFAYSDHNSGVPRPLVVYLIPIAIEVMLRQPSKGQYFDLSIRGLHYPRSSDKKATGYFSHTI